jgi:hypothetical protein
VLCCLLFCHGILHHYAPLWVWRIALVYLEVIQIWGKNVWCRYEQIDYIGLWEITKKPTTDFARCNVRMHLYDVLKYVLHERLVTFSPYIKYCLHYDEKVRLFLLSFFRGYALTQLIKALRYNPEGRGFDSTFNLSESKINIPWITLFDNSSCCEINCYFFIIVFGVYAYLSH